jgi:hypothetical protein
LLECVIEKIVKLEGIAILLPQIMSVFGWKHIYQLEIKAYFMLLIFSISIRHF